MNADVVIARFAADQHGMVARRQLLDAGLSARQVDVRAAQGVLRIVFPGVYAHTACPSTWRGRLMGAVLLTGEDAAASHRSAAALHGLEGVPRFRPEVSTTAADHPRSSGIIVHRTNLLGALDRTAVDGVPCTSVARTLLDLGAILPYQLVEAAVQHAVITKVVTHDQLIAVLERVGTRGRRGTAPLRAVVRHALPDGKLESELERRLVALLPPGFVLQHELVCVDGRRVRFDAALPDRKIAVEGKGFTFHGTTRRRMEEDAARARSIQASGWTLYEYGWSDVTERAIATRAELHSFFGALITS